MRALSISLPQICSWTWGRIYLVPRTFKVTFSHGIQKVIWSHLDDLVLQVDSRYSQVLMASCLSYASSLRMGHFRAVSHHECAPTFSSIEAFTVKQLANSYSYSFAFGYTVWFPSLTQKFHDHFNFHTFNVESSHEVLVQFVFLNGLVLPSYRNSSEYCWGFTLCSWHPWFACKVIVYQSLFLCFDMDYFLPLGRCFCSSRTTLHYLSWRCPFHLLTAILSLWFQVDSLECLNW